MGYANKQKVLNLLHYHWRSRKPLIVKIWESLKDKKKSKILQGREVVRSMKENLTTKNSSELRKKPKDRKSPKIQEVMEVMTNMQANLTRENSRKSWNCAYRLAFKKRIISRHSQAINLVDRKLSAGSEHGQVTRSQNLSLPR
jgi:hypothetical protein